MITNKVAACIYCACYGQAMKIKCSQLVPCILSPVGIILVLALAVIVLTLAIIVIVIALALLVIFVVVVILIIAS